MQHFINSNSIRLPFSNHDILIVKDIDIYTFFYTKDKIIYRLDKEKESLEEITKLKNIGSKNQNSKYTSNLIDFNKDKIVYISEGSIFLHDIISSKIIKEIRTILGFPVESITEIKLFKDKFLILGNWKGEVFIINLEGRIYNSLTKVFDAIQDINISKRYISVITTGDRIDIYHKETLRRLNFLRIPKARFSSVKHINSNIYVTSTSGDIYILSPFSKNFNKIKVTNNKIINIQEFGKYILIFPEYEKYILYNSISKKKEITVLPEELKFLSFYNNKYFFLEKERFNVINIEATKENNFPKIKDDKKTLKEKSIFIKKSFLFNMEDAKLYLDSFWNESLKLALSYIEKKEFKKAMLITSRFSAIEAYKDYCSGITISASIVKSYEESIENNHYNRSYELSSSYKFLQLTNSFKKLEKLFFKSLLKFTEGNSSLETKIELNKFKYVREKQDLIQLALKDTKILTTFKQHLIDKKTEEIISSLKRYKTLVFLPEFIIIRYKFFNLYENRYNIEDINELKKLLSTLEKSNFNFIDLSFFRKEVREFSSFLLKINSHKVFPIGEINTLNPFIFNSNEFKSTTELFYNLSEDLSMKKLLNKNILDIYSEFLDTFFKEDVYLILVKKYELELEYLLLKRDKRIFKSLKLFNELIGETFFTITIKQRLNREFSYSSIENRYFKLKIEDLPLSLIN